MKTDIGNRENQIQYVETSNTDAYVAQGTLNIKKIWQTLFYFEKASVGTLNSCKKL